MMKSDFAAADNTNSHRKIIPYFLRIDSGTNELQNPRLLRQVFQILGSLAPANKGILYYDRLKKVKVRLSWSTHQSPPGPDLRLRKML